jgi:hypothetical protein
VDDRQPSTPSACALGSAPSDRPLARLKRPEVLHRNEPRCIGFNASRAVPVSMHHRALFRSGLARLLLRLRAILPRPLSSSEFLHHADSAPLGFSSELGPFGPGSPATGFRPSSRHHVHAATSAQDTQPYAMFRPQAFTASRRVAPHARLQAYFIPQPRPGFSSFKDFSLHAATLSRRQEPAPVPFLREMLARLAPASTPTNVDFEASIRAKMRSTVPSYSPNTRPLPSSSFAPPGPSSSPQPPAYPAASAPDISA